jgi:hypothetical protein
MERVASGRVKALMLDLHPRYASRYRARIRDPSTDSSMKVLSPVDRGRFAGTLYAGC